jgi:hypothetical protein
MPSNRKGHAVQVFQFANPLTTWPSSVGWRYVASQRTLRQAMKVAAEWRRSDHEVRVLNPEREVIKHWTKK